MGFFKKNLLKTDYIEDFKVFRALFLYFLFQTERINRLQNKKSEFNLSDMLKMSEDDLNVFTEVMRKKFKVIGMNTIDGHLLFFPDIGFFSFPVICSNKGYAVNGYALPLYSNLSLCLIPSGPSDDDLHLSRNIMMQFSVGLNSQNCLIPKELENEDERKIIETIFDFKEKALIHQNRCNSINFLVQAMYRSAGLNFDEIIESKQIV